jgi:ABC-type sugar transport system ATPase subunit
VFQEDLVAGARSVLENVWLGADDLWRTKIPAREKRRLAKAALEELLDRPIDLSTAMEDLSLSDRQAGCISVLCRAAVATGILNSARHRPARLGAVAARTSSPAATRG